MFLTTHFTVGIAVGLATGNPILGAAAGLVSHHVLDRVPHIDAGSSYVGKKEPDSLLDFKWWEKLITAGDIIIAALVLLWLLVKFSSPVMDVYVLDIWTKNDSIILWSAIGAAFPDLFYNISKLLSPKFSYPFTGKPFVYYHRFHEWMHQTISWKWWHVGLATQAVLIGGSLWWILSKLT